MLRTLFMLAVIIIGFSGWANPYQQFSQGGSQMGELQGSVTDQSGNPLDMVEVVVTRNGNELGHAFTNQNGHYTIPIEVGTYTVYFQRTEYRTVEMPGVVIRSGGITFLDQQLEPTTINLPPIVVKPREEIIDTDGKGPIFKVRGPMLDKKPTQEWQGVLTTAPGVYVRDDGAPFSMGGGRTYNNIIVVDDVIYYDSAPAIPLPAIEEISVSLTGVSAKYGDFTGGVIEITTRSF